MKDERQVIAITSAFIVPTSSLDLSCFRHFVAFNATGADFHAHVAALRALHADLLQVGVETPAGAIVRVGDVVTELRAFAADFASFCHDCLSTSE
jgi:hypothetical protein